MRTFLLLAILALTTSGSSFSIQPTDGGRSFFEYQDVSAGQTLNDEAILINNSDSDLTLEVWGAKALTNNSLNYVLMGRDYKGGAVDWIRFPGGVYEVPAHGSIRLPFRIEVPATAKDGEYMAGLLAQVNRAGGDSGISIIAQSGAMISIQVGEPDKCSVKILGIETEQQGENLRVTLALLNTGNLHFTGSGFITFERGDFKFDQPLDARKFLAGDHAEMKFRISGLDPGKYQAGAALISDEVVGCMATFESEVLVVPPTLPNVGPPAGVSEPVEAIEVETSTRSLFCLLSILALIIGIVFILMVRRSDRIVKTADDKRWNEYKNRRVKK